MDQTSSFLQDLGFGHIETDIFSNEKCINLGMRVIMLAFGTYVYEIYPTCPSSQMTLLEHKYISKEGILEISDLIGLKLTHCQEDRIKAVRAVFGFIYSQPTGFELCLKLTRTIFGAIEILLPQCQDDRTYVKQLFERLNLSEPKIVVKKDQLQLELDKKTRQFFKSNGIQLPKVLVSCKVQVEHAKAKSEIKKLLSLAKVKLNEFGINIDWVNQARFNGLLINFFSSDQVSLIRTKLTLLKLSHLEFKFKPIEEKLICSVFGVQGGVKKLIHTFQKDTKDRKQIKIEYLESLL